MDKYEAKLEKELRQLERELADITQIMSDMHKQKHVLEKKVHAARSRLEQTRFSVKELIVSDHAVLRYAEREHGFGFDEVKEEIKRLMAGAENLGSLRFRGFIVKGHTVVTYIPPNEEGNA